MQALVQLITANCNIDKALAAASVDITGIKFKSTKYTNADLVVTVTDGVPTFSSTNTDFAAALGL